MYRPYTWMEWTSMIADAGVRFRTETSGKNNPRQMVYLSAREEDLLASLVKDAITHITVTILLNGRMFTQFLPPMTEYARYKCFSKEALLSES